MRLFSVIEYRHAVTMLTWGCDLWHDRCQAGRWPGNAGHRRLWL